MKKLISLILVLSTRRAKENGLCALFMVASSYGANTTTGTGFEMDAIAMAVFGGISSTGGKGNMVGGVISAFIIVCLRIGLGQRNVNAQVILLIIGGIAYYISDIELRMLVPREQYDAMAFPPDYAIERDYLGNAYPKNQQTAKCGNAVSPVISYAMVWANLPEWCSERITTMAQLESRVAV